MKQHNIDLLPEALRARAQAGLRTGRYVTSVLLGIGLVVAVTLHSRFGLDRTLGAFDSARGQADQVLATLERSSVLRDKLLDLEDSVERYRSIAHPIEISRILASVINRMPEGTTLDRFDLSAGSRSSGRNSRSGRRSSSDDGAPRVLVGEVAGFAPDDRAIAEFVSGLQDLDPLEGVSLDFSRTRSVHDRAAREFRLSFRVNFEALYESTELATKDEAHDAR